MKALYKLILTLFLFGFANYTSAQCGPTHVDPNPQMLGFCEGTTDTIHFVSPGNCTGNYEYQVKNAANAIVQAWSTATMYISTPVATETYTVEARCSTCPTTVVTDTFMIEVIEDPIITADTFVCYGTQANFSATGDTSTNLAWWDSEVGGNQLSTDSAYTSPPMTQDDTLYMQVTGTVTAGAAQGSILITEAGLEGFAQGSISGSEDYLEISNLYSNPVNTAGWFVAISSSYSNINSVNSIIWNLPNSFAPCSILYRTDASGQSDYWGNNILWNPNQPGWVAIVNDVGDIVDFISWGWTQAQLAGFSPTVNGYTLSLGTEWTGNSCPNTCGVTGGVPYSLSRNGSSDSNTAADFVCQATSLNVINPGLNCGWISSNISCPHEVIATIDSLPSATTPDTTFVQCYADIPAPDPSIITNVTDDYTTSPTVTFFDETTDGNTCPETITRTYHVSDSCNYVEIEHIIVVHDTTTPTMDPAPADLFVDCPSQIPPIASLNWSDNCLGSGTLLGTETSSGTTCPEVLTRTWTVTDSCGNSVTRTQVITVNDTLAPVIEPAPADLALQCPSEIPPMVSLNYTDNCLGSGVLQGVETTDGLTCPETITRTWTITDDCGNTSTEVQVIVVNDDTPPTASNLPSVQLAVLPAPDSTLVSDAADNCGTPIVEWVSDVSDGGFCPENVVRTYSVTDDCGNVTFVTRKFTIGDMPPEADFSSDPTLLDNFSSGEVDFSNYTTGAVSYEWDFGDGSPIVNTVHPTHQFDISESTTYKVWLTASSQYGCLDSANILINVFQELVYFVPNAFTPDNDELNQTFKPVFVAGFDVNDYKFQVYNRWGEILFESNDHNTGWDGTYGNQLVPVGTYLYKLEFGLKDDDSRKIVKGNFSLIK